MSLAKQNKQAVYTAKCCRCGHKVPH